MDFCLFETSELDLSENHPSNNNKLSTSMGPSVSAAEGMKILYILFLVPSEATYILFCVCLFFLFYFIGKVVKFLFVRPGCLILIDTEKV